MNKLWMNILFVFSALFFVMATYYLVLLIRLPGHHAPILLYRTIAGYFLCAILYWIAAKKRKKINRRIFK